MFQDTINMTLKGEDHTNALVKVRKIYYNSVNNVKNKILIEAFSTKKTYQNTNYHKFIMLEILRYGESGGKKKKKKKMERGQKHTEMLQSKIARFANQIYYIWRLV